VVFVELIAANAVRTDWGLEFVGLSTKVFGSDQRSAMLTVCRSYAELDTVNIHVTQKKKHDAPLQHRKSHSGTRLAPEAAVLERAMWL
jgi:hypothetical protein